MSQKVLTRLRDLGIQYVETRIVQPTSVVTHAGLHNQHSADMLLEWLAAVSMNKKVDDVWAAARAYARIFAKSNSIAVLL